MTRIRVITTGGEHVGDDERTAIECIEAVREVSEAHNAYPHAPHGKEHPHPHDPEMPSGWVWIADGYFRASAVTGVAHVSMADA